MTLTVAQLSLIPFGFAVLIGWSVVRGLRSGVFHVRGSTFERGEALFEMHAVFMTALSIAFFCVGCRSLFLAYFGF